MVSPLCKGSSGFLVTTEDQRDTNVPGLQGLYDEGREEGEVRGVDGVGLLPLVDGKGRLFDKCPVFCVLCCMC